MAAQSGPKPPPRAQVSLIIKRYLKPEATEKGVPRSELVQFYRLWRQYPSAPFWERHELGFKLNSLYWFSTPEGAETLARDYLVFHFEFAPPPEAAPVEVSPDHVDKTTQPSYYQPTTPARPKTTAEFLRRQP